MTFFVSFFLLGYLDLGLFRFFAVSFFLVLVNRALRVAITMQSPTVCVSAWSIDHIREDNQS